MARKEIGESIGINIERENQTVYITDEFYTEKNRLPFTLENILAQAINTSVCHPAYLGEKIEIFPSEGILSLRQYRIVLNHLLGNLIGIEYVKTPGRKFNTHGCYLQCLEGKIAIVLHKSKFNTSTFSYEATETYLVSLSKGLGFIVPSDFEYTVINLQLKDAVFVEIHHSEAVYQSVFENHKGAAYYIIHKNSKREIVRNPYFKNCSLLQKINLYGTTHSMFSKPFLIPMLFQNIKDKEDERIEYLSGKRKFDIKTVL